MKCFHAKSEVFKMILGAVTLQLCGILIRSCGEINLLAFIDFAVKLLGFAIGSQ